LETWYKANKLEKQITLIQKNFKETEKY